MRETFSGWCEPSADDIGALWSHGMVVTDTNVLLDLYRLTPTSRESLVKALNSVSDRLWIPHQVGLEFHKSRDQARADVRQRHTGLAQRISSDVNKLVKQVQELRTFNPAIDRDETMRPALAKAAKEMGDELKLSLTEYDEAEGVVQAELDKLFPESRIGRPFDNADQLRARREAEERFESRIPPGFRDAGKSGDLRYGDYYLWKQLLARAGAMQSGVIFITRDEKEDWQKYNTILPELAYEFAQETGRKIIVLHPDSFVRESLSRGLWRTEPDEDVSEVAKEYERVDQADAASLRNSTSSRASFLSALQRALEVHYQTPRSTLDGLTIDPVWVRQAAASTAGIDWTRLGSNLTAAQLANYGLLANEAPSTQQVDESDDNDDDEDNKFLDSEESDEENDTPQR